MDGALCIRTSCWMLHLSGFTVCKYSRNLREVVESDFEAHNFCFEEILGM